ncbi:TPA: hypothetical protein SOL98_001206 [Clostridioides difficile]|uniref:hypothetical protein n=1 Tax=Clostridioides difficile TaxID=1496 RepID=UPI000938EB96|nr:hypothetical protein [Clostridioides difficile]EGT3757662.1 hypothetical protein [Clostridioides difficile]EGT4159436.1 hypothetical protein [Clostridioides difficile]EGT4635072.1 hypothetical protein [Clostridioides difficile]EGT4831768.1 hypothetical protein [Clostridioides difficile]EII6777324.1 hypothetical protein [Clostridioides difficile]
MRKLRADKIIKTINRGIALNPQTITIEQGIKQIVDGAIEVTNKVKELTVVIYPEKTNDTVVSSETIGTAYKNKNFGMVVDKEADLKLNTENEITFKCIEGTMKLNYVNPIVVEEKICGYICGLEKID